VAVLNFGKFSGVPLAKVPSWYLVWALDNLRKLRPAVRRAIEQELRQRPDIEEVGDHEGAVVFNGEQLARTWLREMSRRWHPDRGGSTEAMQAVNDGFDLLNEMLVAEAA
jgi:hypothetical protein